MQSTVKSSADTDISLEESISAWMDGEASEDIFPDLATVQGRRTWDTYHLIGDALRNTDLAVSPSASFHARLSRALDAELPIVAPQRRRSPLRMGLSGLAVAAAVATVAWVAQPYIMGGSSRPAETRVLADASPAETPGLRDYLEAHRQMAGPSAVRQVSFDAGAGR
ncbi:sigma-E factor negative regulatory protein [Bordetella petrii]|uniref:Membrane protein n=1 Tax=Bordetella petrii (strain ATCC BAA-461 / DSM 12804 / CCUG 43448 / CIP 107267 / Se-1111R) TaxID=340100 RepID=A9III6_BORPD|nr:sigma-E factor negative regulatory protein [Bordetella petrii]CAP42098.1 putative membrane protein [Bordetella petrii]